MILAFTCGGFFSFYMWASFSSNSIWVNLFKFIFFILPLFHSQQNKKSRENKIFSILPLFHPPTIFYPPTFSPLQPNGPLECVRDLLICFSLFKVFVSFFVVFMGSIIFFGTIYEFHCIIQPTFNLFFSYTLKKKFLVSAK